MRSLQTEKGFSPVSNCCANVGAFLLCRFKNFAFHAYEHVKIRNPEFWKQRNPVSVEPKLSHFLRCHRAIF